MGKFEKIEEQIEEQTEILYKLLQEMQARETTAEGITIQQETLSNILQQVQTQEMMLKKTNQHVEQQQEMLNIIFRQVTGNHPPAQFKPSSNILDRLDLDMEKIANIAMYIVDLFSNSSENKDESKTEE